MSVILEYLVLRVRVIVVVVGDLVVFVFRVFRRDLFRFRLELPDGQGLDWATVSDEDRRAWMEMVSAGSLLSSRDDI